MKESLEGEITIVELANAVKQLKRGKSPGCDGIIAEFYMVNFKLVGEILLNAINEGYREGELHGSALRGVITLIPKANKDTRRIECMRPISLLCTDFKLIEKCMANRIKPALDLLIDADQKGFLEGRNISCNIRRVLDVIDHADSEELDGLIVQIDFMKCFDRVETSALIESLRYFNFGESFIQWTKVLYNKSQSCVINNGKFTPWFKVTRSVKQGGPCSAYYFLVIAEVLAIELRKNKNLDGFMVKDILRLFGQFADDIDIYIRANERSLNAIIDTFTIFEKNSGFKINYNKTTVYRIGTIKNCSSAFYTKRPLAWCNDSINVLGVQVSNDAKELNHLNYTQIVRKAEMTLNKWKDRNLSLIGKVLIVNSLVASLFVYKMSVLPTIGKETIENLNKIVEAFIWNNKKPKIKLKYLQMHKKCGGLNLINFELKDQSLKASWLKWLQTDPYVNAFAMECLKTVLEEEIWLCNLKEPDIRKRFKNHFWTDVLIAWSKLNFTKQPDVDQIGKQYIWLNSCLRSAGEPFIFTTPYKNGLTTLNQLINPSGELIPKETLKQMFNLEIMQYNIIMSALPKSWRTTLCQQQQCNDATLYEKFTHSKKCAAHFYKMVNTSNEALKAAYQKWKKVYNDEVEYDEFCLLFDNMYCITNNAKLRSFRYRELHSAIVTNQHLYRWKVTDNNLCYYCKQEKETYVHLIAECYNVKKTMGRITSILH